MKKSLLSYFFFMLLFSNFNCQKTSLDTSFGDNGMVTTPLFTPKAIKLQKDGKILVAGEFKRPVGTSSSYTNYIMYRFNTDGSVDEGFGTNGKVSGNASSNETVMALYETQDNKIVLVMKRTGPAIFKRFDSNGSMDTTLGSNGEKVFSLLSSSYSGLIDIAQRMILAEDNKIVLTGATHRFPIIPTIQAKPFSYVVRLNQDFTLETTFNNIGYRKFENIFYDIGLVDIDKNGSITTGFKGTTIKILANGQMDASFGNNGVKSLNPGSSITVKHVRSDQNGNYILSGSMGGTDKRAFLMRYNPNGEVDSNYGSSGFAYIPNSSDSNETAMQSMFFGNGKTLSAVDKFRNGFDFGLVFTNSNGSTDNSVGDQGQIITEMDNDQRISVIEKQADGKILAAGYESDRMILIRYDISEILDVKLTETNQSRIFPNPAKDHINIEAMKPLSDYVIRNSSGQIIVKGVAKDKKLKINISQYSTGIYYITTSGGTFKFIKQ